MEQESGTKKIDRRVLKTRQAIEEALASLILKTDYDKITVSALAKEANINRKTFYLHYDSVDDVLDAMTKRHAQKTMERIKASGVLDTVPLDVDGVAHEIGESYRQTRLFNPIFMEKLPIKHLISAMTPYWVEAIKRKRAAHGLKPLENTEYYARFILGGMFEAYESWYNSGDDVPFNEIARIVAKAMTRGVNGILEAE